VQGQTGIDDDRKRLPAAERRAVIERVAGKLFGERGYEATTLAQIAAAASVTKPVLYRHFESKKALYLALLERHEQDLSSFVEPGGPGLGEQLPQILDGWLRYVAERGYQWRMLFRDSGGDEEIRRHRREVQERAREVMVAILARAEPPLPLVQLEPSAEMVRAGMAGLALWWLDHPEAERADLVAVIGRLLAGVVAPA
jgi:AcrR family transcriptional regulator